LIAGIGPSRNAVIGLDKVDKELKQCGAPPGALD
jgi:hypothetical protein